MKPSSLILDQATAVETLKPEGVQRRSTRIDAQVVVGAHGTLKNWITKRVLGIAQVRILVLDEADEMLKVGVLADQERAKQPCMPAVHGWMQSGVLPVAPEA